MPVFQRGQHWIFNHLDLPCNYDEGKCPVAEKLWKDDFFLSLYHGLPLDSEDRMDIVDAFTKVWENRGELK
jgi:hypothetical protein